MQFTKEIVSPGSYWYIDERTQLPAVYEATPERIRHHHDAGKAMLASGLTIPVPLEHQKSALPMTAAERAAQRLRDHAGWVTDVRMEGDTLYGVVDVDDAKDPQLARQVERAKFTSPWFTSFVDGNGRRWDDVIGHLAVTTRPRIIKQAPFQSVAAALAMTPPKPTSPPSYTLTRAALLKKDAAGRYAPAFPRAFSLASGVPLAAEDLPPKKKKDEPPPKKGGDEPPAKKGEGDGDGLPGDKPPGGGGESPEPSVDEDGDVSLEEVLCDLLEIKGVKMPEGCTEENFMACLYAAVMAAVKEDAGVMPDEPEDDPMNPSANPTSPGTGTVPKPASPVVAESPPLYMGLSLTDLQAQAATVTDPTTKRLLEAALSMYAGQATQAEALKKNAFNRALALRDERIAAVRRRRGGEKAAALLAEQAKSASLSLEPDGTVKDSMAAALDLVDATLAGLPSLPELLINPGAAREVPHPREYDPKGITPERAEQVANELMGGPQRVAAGGSPAADGAAAR